ncbi:ParB/RepB/Spo0J family partition protein [Candidatus Woesebacteria bacterium]|nr:ParB/RepB/Spo0J family partition protein [Candidatus Woesebacteria bacterium]
MKDQNVKHLAVELLQTNPFQPRDKIHKEDLEDLVKSIKIHGVIEPLIIAHTPAGYQIIAGERRWRAAQLANLKVVPTIIKETTPKGMLEMAIVENLQRVNLTAIERAQSFQRLLRNFNLNVGEIAERLGKSSSYISNSLKLLDLPDAIKDGMLGKQITEGHARAISGIQDHAAMIQVYKQVLKENASVRRAEELARLAKSKTGQTRIFKPNAVVYQIDDKEIEVFENKIKRYLGAKARLKLHRTAKQTRVSFIIKGDVEDTQKSLEKIISMLDKAIKDKKSDK